MDPIALNNVANIAKEHHATLIAVSKTYPVSDIREVYNAGIRDFGENRVQELLDKKDRLPADIRWHLIGHLQTNKVKFIVPFIHLIHSVDSERLVLEINRQAEKCGKIVDVLLQVYIAEEETKFGFSPEELVAFLDSAQRTKLANIRIRGLMGMASFTDNMDQVRKEFCMLKALYDRVSGEYFEGRADFNILSMGMSGDYETALEEGSNMIRVGSLIFGKRAVL